MVIKQIVIYMRGKIINQICGLIILGQTKQEKMKKIQLRSASTTLFLMRRLGYTADGVVGLPLKSNRSRHHL